MRMACREASHAGSWYSDNAEDLTRELDQWLRSSGLPKLANARAVIAPHAGYRYSGRCAAYAFASIDPQRMNQNVVFSGYLLLEGSRRQRVFLLGPSHHHYTRKCALSRATVYKTPIGDLPIDHEVYDELRATGRFEDMDMSVDEAEHSIEMHLPYLAKAFKGASVKIIPILVGSCPPESEGTYGRLLAKYIDDPTNFFSISSDFCHWGSRFGYQYYEMKRGPIYKSIEALDQSGMDVIESGNPDAFQEYLTEFENTICGRHAIGVFLHVLKHCTTQMHIKFLQYEQSSQCKSMRDSSVSYASAVVTALQ